MELYHLHLLGNHDRLYKENKEFVVDPTKFNNRIYNRIYNATPNVDVYKYARMVKIINYYCAQAGYRQFDRNINVGELIEFIIKQGASEDELFSILNDAKEMLLAEGINSREMAMEEYRKENCPTRPSRMHSLFACTEEGIEFWRTQIMDNDVEIFRVDVMDEPFVSNSGLLPDETLPYGAKIQASYKYFNPSKKDLGDYADEYLVQGKVRVLKKVDEIRN